VYVDFDMPTIKYRQVIYRRHIEKQIRAGNAAPP
jgi:hypothetical protein